MIRKFLLLSALAWPFSAPAADGISLELGRGDESSNLVRGAVQWTLTKDRPLGRRLQWGAYLELSLGQWQNGERVTDLGLTPVLRLEHATGRAIPYLEAGIGLHLESQVRFSEQRASGSKFQFGDHVGAGVRFGPGLRHDLGVRLQHLSNGGVAEPNPGINFVILRYQYHYD
jgi:hypothetical protein